MMPYKNAHRAAAKLSRAFRVLIVEMTFFICSTYNDWYLNHKHFWHAILASMLLKIAAFAPSMRSLFASICLKRFAYNENTPKQIFKVY